MSELNWETADCKSCIHGYVFPSKCPECIAEKKEIFERGLKEGIWFATSQFLGALPIQVYHSIIDETVRFLYKEYFDHDKELSKGNV